jgi:S-adenosyl-L-methionine hydrolase (adenosine-forming)
VVDPGVGTDRHPIVINAGGHFIVCPDNGLATLFLRENPLDEARIIQNPRFMQDVVSATFHGRDIFAPAAAWLAAGEPLAHFGDELDAIVMLDLPKPTKDSTKHINGEIVHIDRFGNLITNIHYTMLEGAVARTIHVGQQCLQGMQRTYAEVPPGIPLAIFGSYGYLEVAINGANASEAFHLSKGDKVSIGLGKKGTKS